MSAAPPSRTPFSLRKAPGELPPRNRPATSFWARVACRIDRGRALYRFLLLSLSVTVVFSGYFAFDLPSITSAILKAKLRLSNEQFGALFSVYAMPNVLLPMLSGVVFSKLGKWRGVTVIATVISAGVCVVFVGVWLSSYPVLLLGRVLYGLGGESVYVGVDLLITKWFQGAEIGLAYGLVQAAGQAGSFAAFYIVPPTDAFMRGDITFVYGMSVVISLIALLCLGLARAIEVAGRGLRQTPQLQRSYSTIGLLERGDRAHNQTEVLAGALMTGTYDGVGNAVAKKFGTEEPMHSTVRRPNERTSLLTAGRVSSSSSAQADRPGAFAGAARQHEASASSQDIETGGEAREEGIAVDEGEEDDTEDPDVADDMARTNPCSGMLPCFDALWRLLGLGYLRTVPLDFWFVLASIAAYSSAFYTFLAFGNDWLQGPPYSLSAQASGQLVGVISIFSCIVSPTVGLVLDKVGGQREAAFASMLGATASFAIMGFTTAPVPLSVVMAGLCYSVLPAALYPVLTQVVPERSFTTVYGITNSAINAVLALAYYLAGILSSGPAVDPSTLGGRAGRGAAIVHVLRALAASAPSAGGGYERVFLMFVAITAVGTVATGALVYLARRRGRADGRAELPRSARTAASSSASAQSTSSTHSSIHCVSFL
jgi:MFS family permease